MSVELKDSDRSAVLALMALLYLDTSERRYKAFENRGPGDPHAVDDLAGVDNLLHAVIAEVILRLQLPQNEPIREDTSHQEQGSQDEPGDVRTGPADQNSSQERSQNPSQIAC